MSGILDNGTLSTGSQLEAIYIGYFGRAADAGGLAYWQQNYAADIAAGLSVDQTLNSIANAFAPQAETIALYPDLAFPITSLSTLQLEQLVDQIYVNLFGRNPGTGDAGVNYWVGQLQHGAVQLGQAIVAIANGATGTDATVLENRIAVAATFSADTAAAGIGLTNPSQVFIQEARNLVLSVNSTAGSVSAADNAILAFVANGGTALTIGPNLTFTLTVGQDTFTSGGGNDLYYAPLSGVFGNQPTLTPFDKLVDSGNGNTLEGFFNNGAAAAAGLTIQGIQTWDFSNAMSGTTTLTGVAFGLGGPGPVGGATNPGVQTINYQYSGNGAANTLTVGAAGAGGGIQSLLTGTAAAPAINVLFNSSGGTTNTVNVFVGANQWTGVANSTLVVATNSGSTGFDIGPDVATAGAGYVNWVVQDQTAHSGATDTLTLGAQGNANGVAHTLTITGANGGAAAANITLIGDAAGAPAWSGLTMLTGNVNGFFTVTGAETANGLLSGNATNLLSITDTGTGGSLFDLSSMTNAAVHAMTAITGGAGLGEVEFNNGVIGAAFSTPIALTNIDDIADSVNATGTLNVDMRNFPLAPGAGMFPVEGATGSAAPSFSELQFLTAASATSGGAIGTLTITNGLTDFFVQLNAQADASNMTVSIGLSNLNGGINALAVGLDGQAIPTFTDNNYTTTDIVLGGSTTLGSTNFIDNQIIGDPLPGVVNISGTGALILGNTVTPVEGTATVQINGIGVTAISDSATGNLTLGVTNAHSVTYSGGTGVLDMTAPGTDISGDFTVTTTAENVGLGSLVQGSLGAVTLIGGNAIAGSPGNFSGNVGNNSISIGAGGDSVAGAGGADTINESAHTVIGNAILFGGYENINAAHASITGANVFTSLGAGSSITSNIVIQEITDGADDAYQGFWGQANGALPATISSLFGGAANGGTSADMTTINGFVAGSGTAHDVLVFLSDAWDGGEGFSGSLFNAGATVIHNTANSLAGTPTVGVVVPNGAIPQVVAGDNFIIDNFTTMNNAAQLALDLNTIFPITLPTGVTAGTNEHMLFAYQSPTGVNIADVDFVSTAGTTTNTNAATMHIYASDMVHLAGVSLSSLTNADIHFA